MSTTQYVSRFPVKTPIPPVISGIERINLRNGSIIYPGSDGNIYGVTTSGTTVNLTSTFSADLTGLQNAITDLTNRMNSVETLLGRAVSLLESVTGVNVNTQSNV
jgi:hypothetical protein